MYHRSSFKSNGYAITGTNTWLDGITSTAAVASGSNDPWDAGDRACTLPLAIKYYEEPRQRRTPWRVGLMSFICFQNIWKSVHGAINCVNSAE